MRLSNFFAMCLISLSLFACSTATRRARIGVINAKTAVLSAQKNLIESQAGISDSLASIHGANARLQRQLTKDLNKPMNSVVKVDSMILIAIAAHDNDQVEWLTKQKTKTQNFYLGVADKGIDASLANQATSITNNGSNWRAQHARSQARIFRLAGQN